MIGRIVSRILTCHSGCVINFFNELHYASNDALRKLATSIFSRIIVYANELHISEAIPVIQAQQDTFVISFENWFSKHAVICLL